MTDLFNMPILAPGLPKPCKHPNYLPQHLAPPHPDDADDAVGLKGEADNRGACCAVHYVQHLRWKYDLDY